MTSVNIRANLTGPQVRKPQYGAEGSRGSAVDHFANMTGVLDSLQAQRPVPMPFAPGTPTGAGRELIEQAKYNAANLELQQQQENRLRTAGEQPKAMTQDDVLTALRTAQAKSINDLYDKWVAGSSFAGGRPDAASAEAWITEQIPAIKAGIYQDLGKYGFSDTEVAEGMALDLENLLRARSGLKTTTPTMVEEKEKAEIEQQNINDLRSKLRLK